MKFLLISNDEFLTKTLKVITANLNCDIVHYIGSPDLLDLITLACTDEYEILVIDDDFIRPHTSHLLHSIKKIKKNIKIIFLTTDQSVQLGREIAPLGIHYYGIKPINKSEMKKLILSEVEKNNSHNLYN